MGIAIEQVNQFKQAWVSHAYKFTKEYTSIYAGQLVDLLKELPPPLGVGAEGSYYDCQILAKKVNSCDGVHPGSPRELASTIFASSVFPHRTSFQARACAEEYASPRDDMFSPPENRLKFERGTSPTTYVDCAAICSLFQR